MAILKGLEAAVVVNGHELIEYEDDGSDEPGASNTVTKYVEAVSGAEFEVILSCMPSFTPYCPSVSFAVSVDGERVNGALLYQKEKS